MNGSLNQESIRQNQKEFQALNDENGSGQISTQRGCFSKLITQYYMVTSPKGWSDWTVLILMNLNFVLVNIFFFTNFWVATNTTDNGLTIKYNAGLVR